MKRIINACVEQTLQFENEINCQGYLRTLNRKHIRHRVVEKKCGDEGIVLLKIIREYNGYPVGEYLNEKTEERK